VLLGHFYKAIQNQWVVGSVEKRVWEWIEFHRMVGVEHFYVYDNSDEPYGHLWKVLARAMTTPPTTSLTRTPLLLMEGAGSCNCRWGGDVCALAIEKLLPPRWCGHGVDITAHHGELVHT
jgi:hypothetical protein